MKSIYGIRMLSVFILSGSLLSTPNKSHAVYHDCIHGGWGTMALTFRQVTTFTSVELLWSHFTAHNEFRITFPEYVPMSATYDGLPPSSYSNPIITSMWTNYPGEGYYGGEAYPRNYNPPGNSYDNCGWTQILTFYPA